MVDADSVLSRLSSYSQNPAKRDVENFTTETVAYLFNSSKSFRRIFLCVVVPSKLMRKRFGSAKAQTQQTLGRGRVDLVLNGTGNQRLFIEVKISAKETVTADDNGEKVSQVHKYIAANAGPVAYLTTRDIPGPELHSKDQRRFLGQSYFESLYAAIKGQRLSEMGDLFTKFLEEQGMAPVAPFSRKEVTSSVFAFDFIDRSIEILNEVRTKITPELQSLFRTKETMRSARYAYHGIISYADGLGPRKSAEIGFKVELKESRLSFYAYVGVGKDVNSRLKSRLPGWELRGGYYWWAAPLRGDGRDTSRMLSHSRKALRRIKKALR